MRVHCGNGAQIFVVVPVERSGRRETVTHDDGTKRKGLVAGAARRVRYTGVTKDCYRYKFSVIME